MSDKWTELQKRLVRDFGNCDTETMYQHADAWAAFIAGREEKLAASRLLLADAAAVVQDAIVLMPDEGDTVGGNVIGTHSMGLWHERAAALLRRLEAVEKL